MAAERLSMRKTREILRQKWELGRTHREVAASVGLSLGAVALTLGRAAGAGLDWAAAQALSDAALEERLYGPRDESAGRPMPDCEYLHAERKKAWEPPTQSNFIRNVMRRAQAHVTARAGRSCVTMGERNGRGFEALRAHLRCGASSRNDNDSGSGVRGLGSGLVRGPPFCRDPRPQRGERDEALPTHAA